MVFWYSNCILAFIVRRILRGVYLDLSCSTWHLLFYNPQATCVSSQRPPSQSGGRRVAVNSVANFAGWGVNVRVFVFFFFASVPLKATEIFVAPRTPEVMH